MSGISPSSSVGSRSGPVGPEVPVKQAFTKRWTKKKQPPVPAPMSLSSQSAWSLPGGRSVRPHTVATSNPEERTVKWGFGMAGYNECPGGPPLSDAQLNAGKSLVKAPTRVRQMIRDPVVQKACWLLGIEPSDLIPKPEAAFTKSEGHAFPVAPDVAKKQWESYQTRMGRRLALVQAERDRLLAEAATTDKEEEDALNRTIVKTTMKEIDTEATRVAREEAELEKMAYVIALEQAQVEEKYAKLDANMQERERRLQARQERLNQQRKELESRAKAREALTAKRNKAIADMEAQVIAELEEEWQEKEKKIQVIREQRAAALEAHKAAKAAEFQRKEKIKAQAEAREVAAKARKLAALEEKEARARETAARLDKTRSSDILDKQLRFKEKRDNAERVKKSVYARKVEFATKLEKKERRLDQWKLAQEAVAEDRKHRAREVHLAKAMYRTYQQDVRQKVPGPGAYKAPPSSVNRPGLNGAQSKEQFKHEFTKIAEYTKHNPGPVYQAPTSLKSSGGRLSKTSGKTDVEETMHRARKLPGAGHYSPSMVRSRSTVTIPEGHFPSDFHHIRERARVEPSPAAYSPARVPRSPPKLKHLTATMRSLGDSIGFKPMFSPLASTAKAHMRRKGKPRVTLSQTM